MSITFTCDNCGTGYRVSEDKAGKRVRCKSCRDIITVPAQEWDLDFEDDYTDDSGDEYYGGSDDEYEQEFVPRPAATPRKPTTKRKKRSQVHSTTPKRSLSESPIVKAGVGGLSFLIAFVGAFFLVRSLFSGGGDFDLLQYSLRDSGGAILFNPARLVNSKMLTPEMRDELVDNMIRENGIDPRTIEQMAMTFKQGDTALDVKTVVAIRFNAPTNGLELAQQFLKPANAEEVTFEGKSYTRMTGVKDLFDPNLAGLPPGFAGLPQKPAGKPTIGVYVPDELTIVVAPEAELKEVIANGGSPRHLEKRLSNLGTDFILSGVIFIDPDQKAPPIGGGNPFAPDPSQIAEKIKAAAFLFDLDGDSLLKLELDATNSGAADEIKRGIDQGIAMLTGMMQMGGGPGGGMGGMPGQDQESMELADKLLKNLTVEKWFSQVTIDLKNPGGLDKAFASLAESFKDNQSMTSRYVVEAKLSQIGLAFHNYHDAHKGFPLAASVDDQGQPLLSWRVHLLPYLGEEELHKQFKLDEPWDSSHNKPLILQIPDVYLPADENSDGTTQIMLVTGAGTAFHGDHQTNIREIADGTSNTILAAEAGREQAVPWTQPTDFLFDPDDPKSTFQFNDTGELRILLFDGNTMSLSLNIPGETLKALITHQGKELPADLSIYEQ